jgi:hypothetical protein
LAADNRITHIILTATLQTFLLSFSDDTKLLSCYGLHIVLKLTGKNFTAAPWHCAMAVIIAGIPHFSILGLMGECIFEKVSVKR